MKAESPVEDEVGIVLPLEAFDGITLLTWLERYGPGATASSTGAKRSDLMARTDLWIRISQAIDQAHGEGVVHRLLRPEVIVVEDCPAPSKVRITGFDLAKQLTTDLSITAYVSTVADDRLVFAAPCDA